MTQHEPKTLATEEVLETATPNLDLALDETHKQQSAFELLFDTDKFEQLQRVAKMYSASDLVPDHYRGNTSNTAIAIQMAMRLNVDPLPFLQSSYIVHGKPGIESKLAIALLHRSGCVKTRISYELTGEGDSRSCTASVVDARTGEVKTQTVTWQIAKSEGWTADKNTKQGGTIKSKWNTITDLMFQYRSAMWLIRAYYPEVIMGMLSVEELRDIEPPATEKANGRKSAPIEKVVEDTVRASERLRVANERFDVANEDPKPLGLFANCQSIDDVAKLLNTLENVATTIPEVDDLKDRAERRIEELKAGAASD